MASEDVLKSVVKNAFGKNTEVLEIKNAKGTGPGENYGSALIFFEATIEDEHHIQKKLFLVAKSLPSSEYLRECFNVKICFPKEAAFYQIVVPEYVTLQKESGYNDEEIFNVFPRFIGTNIGPNGEVDDDTTLVLENLAPYGFRVGSRFDGLDLAHSKLVMREIATFHALGIALKKRKPDIFESVIRKDAGRCLKSGQDKEQIIKNEIQPFSGQVFDFLQTLDECAHLVPRLRRVLTTENFLYEDLLDTYVPREPFSTFAHNDLWVNNIMFNYDESGAPKSLKFLDFQRTKVGSPLCDLLLFLYTSTTLEVMRNNFEELIKLYHDNLFAVLERLGVASEELNWENFRRELSDHAPEELFMSVCLLRVVTGENKTEQSEIGEESFDNFSECADEKSKTRHIEVVLDLERKGWI